MVEILFSIAIFVRIDQMQMISRTVARVVCRSYLIASLNGIAYVGILVV